MPYLHDGSSAQVSSLDFTLSTSVYTAVWGLSWKTKTVTQSTAKRDKSGKVTDIILVVKLFGGLKFDGTCSKFDQPQQCSSRHRREMVKAPDRCNRSRALSALNPPSSRSLEQRTKSSVGLCQIKSKNLKKGKQTMRRDFNSVCLPHDRVCRINSDLCPPLKSVLFRFYWYLLLDIIWAKTWKDSHSFCRNKWNCSLCYCIFISHLCNVT